MTAPDTSESWRRVAPISKSDADHMVASRGFLARYLVDQFREAFGTNVEEVSVEMFPDGLLVTLVADVGPDSKYNVWAHTVAAAFTDAGASVPINVVVRAADELRT